MATTTTPQPSGTMERILRLMSEKKASDVYLSANYPALIKIHGQALPINSQVLPSDAPKNLLAEVLTAASRDGLVSAAHDVSEGGLAQTVVEAALAGETGVRLVLPEGADPFVWLFSESAGRVLVAVPRTEESRFVAMCST